MSNKEWEPSDQFPEPDGQTVTLLNLFKSLADPARLKIVEVLIDGELHPCRVEEFDVDIHKSTLSHHFKVLREAGVTSTRVKGREAAVRLRIEMLNERFPGLVSLLGATDDGLS
jgi:DNA-binding transcriptional ArsR family regulator